MSFDNQVGNAAVKETTSKSDAWTLIQERADTAMQGLQQAGQHHANAAIARHAEALAENSSQIAETLQLLLDPRTAVALAEIKAADQINDRLGKCEPRARVIAYQKVRIPLPSSPSFSQFYSSLPSPEQPALVGASETQSQSEQSNPESSNGYRKGAELPPVPSNGKSNPRKEVSPGFAPTRGR